MKVTYISACLDSSGYAEAARNNIAALHHAGVELDVVPISFESKKTNLGPLGNLTKSLIGPDMRNEIRILHATPPNFHRLYQPNKYNIGYVAWETSQLPDEWVPLINTLNEVWVPSEHNVEVFKNSGITIPVIKIPHTFKRDEETAKSTVIEGLDNNCFIFYSIFQWLERKNPTALLKAYLTEFKADENVALVIKTFRIQPGAEQDADAIRKAIYEIKIRTHFNQFPKLLLIPSLLSDEQMNGLHSQGDCYVSLNRCEGFGIPLVEAMLAKNPVIASDYGGSKDFLNTDNGYPIRCQETPVWGMPWSMYKSTQVWAEPDVMHAKEMMRYVFENQKSAKVQGERGCSYIQDNFNWEVIGQVMKERLLTIEERM